ncbi:mercuric reductase [Syntrophotalea acetylenivorans]|uniref:Mercuric reductase n=1 Tax=Syntrophotalea acetylenivorans TaxID=1842532 RepID=A0A1L3GRY5_9BACT|nr:mercuric reductase [Syntrophotalea acetylenivorans]APG28716.1 mercuric reductase [Syntrophotalea acetylenivorans]
MDHHPLILPSTESNQALIDNVHPRDWINPQAAPCYNLVVIGGGPAGLVTAAGAAGLGAKVALVERSLLGGDCLNLGCVPSKCLIRSGRALHNARQSNPLGVLGTTGLQADFSEVMARLQKVRTGLSDHDSARRFSEELGVDVFLGQGRFAGPDRLLVGEQILTFKKAAICTGARAAAPPIPGLEEAGFLTNETVFALSELPPRLAVFGAGPIGCELAQAFARLGSEVTILEYGPRLLPREDQDAAAIVQETFAAEGIQLRFNVRTQQVERQGTERIITYEDNGHSSQLAVDQILVGIGRAPNIEDLGLETADVDFHPKAGVKVNDRLQTSNPRIFAAGDVCSLYKFTHTADAQARIIIANALFMGRQRNSRLVIPWATYTSPEIAHVGMYEKEARDRGYQVNTLTVPLGDTDRAQIDGETEGFARVHLKKGSDKILGATIVAQHAGEMIGEMALAVTNGIGLAAIGRTLHPYPTQAEIMKKLADAYNRSRLTPRLQKLLGLWLRWQRR